MESREGAAVAPALPTGAREPRWAVSRWVGWALLACFAALVVTGVTAGERPASYDDLRFAVARGDVDEVTVTGGAEAAYRGSATVQVHWRDGLVGRVATVVEVHPEPRRASTPDGVPRVHSVEEDLASYDRRVEVTQEPGYRNGADLLGWRVPVLTAWAGALVWLSTFLLIVAGPPPWRANRWAWFWGLAFAAPVGIPAYLLLGGPTWLFRPMIGARRTRGGVGFLLALLTSVLLDVLAVSLGI